MCVGRPEATKKRHSLRDTDDTRSSASQWLSYDSNQLPLLVRGGVGRGVGALTRQQLASETTSSRTGFGVQPRIHGLNLSELDGHPCLSCFTCLYGPICRVASPRNAFLPACRKPSVTGERMPHCPHWHRLFPSCWPSIW